MAGLRTYGVGFVALAACVSGPAGAKDAKSSAQKQTAGAAYIEQIGAPDDWRSDAAFWTALSTTIPPTAASANSLKLVIADPGNTARQVQTGATQREFVLQWGTRNVASQTLSGSGNRAEAVQISPGALLVGKANAGAGNGPEFDVFGFEVDPGNSGAHNRSPEAGGSGGSAPGQGNTSVQLAQGTRNLERVVQIGWGNSAQEVQQGTGNQSVIVQLGSGNRAESDQDGTQNSSTIVQQGSGNTAVVEQ